MEIEIREMTIPGQAGLGLVVCKNIIDCRDSQAGDEQVKADPGNSQGDFFKTGLRRLQDACGSAAPSG